MSTVSIHQLPISSSPARCGGIRIVSNPGRINALFLNQGERKNDGTFKEGVDVNLAFLESNTGAADSWTLMTKTGSTLAATASASNASGVALAVTGNTTIAPGDYVAVTGANKDKLNGVFLVSATSSTTSIVIDVPYVAASHSGLTAASITEVDPVTVAPGGSESWNFLTQKKLVQIVGWGTGGGGYCRMDLQFQGLLNFGSIDIEVDANKQGFGFDGNGAAGTGGPPTAAWPETP